MTPTYRYRAQCARVIDGDTYHLDIDLGFHCAITVPVRLRGVNCPELNTDAGKLARGYAADLLLSADGPGPLVVESYRDRQTFARWVCDVWLPNQRSLADLLIAAGHGTAAGV